MQENNRKQTFSVPVGKPKTEEVNFEKFAGADSFITGNNIFKPSYEERINNRWNIVNWGTDNLFPQHLVNILSCVPEHSAAAKRYTDLISGQGFNIPSQISSNYKAFISNEFGEETLIEVAYKLAYDLNVFGCYAIEITYAKNGKNIAILKHIPVQNLRKAVVKDGEVEGYYYSENWSKPTKHTPIFVPEFNTKLSTKEFPTQIYFNKQYFPNTDVYSIPSYYSVINWLLLEYNIGLFHISNIKAGFKPSIIFSFAQEPEKEVQEKIYAALKEKYEGAENAGQIILLFSPNAEGKPEIKEIQPNNNDKQYLEMIQLVTQKILSGWRIPSPDILGIPSAKGFSNGNELLINEYRLQTTVINQLQSFIEKDLNYLASFNGIYDPIIFNKYIDEERFATLSKLYTSNNTAQPSAAATTADTEDQNKKNNLI